MTQLITTLVALLGDRAKEAARNDDGATAIEWVIFGVLAVVIATAVAAAITLAVNNRLPGIA